MSGVGRLLWTMPAGTRLETAEAEHVRRWRLSGAVLFRQNLESLEQARRLVADLHAASPDLAFVAADQEGGRVTRLPAPATRFPSAMAQGATGDPSLAEAAAHATARQLRAFGVTVNLAPVADVNANPRNPSIGTRSFGADPARVADFVAATVRGTLRGGVLPVAKHFPGKGGTPVDPHLDLPVVADGLDVLRARDLGPFHAAVAAGVPLVMVGHAAFSALEPEVTPSTLAAPIYRLLREEVAFPGLAITDALRMQAVADRFGLPQAAALALCAGADVVLPLAEEDEVLAHLAEAAASGRVPAARLEEAERRLEEARRLLASLPDADPASVPWGEHEALALAIARAALTLVRDEAGWLPLDRRGLLLVECATDPLSQVEEGRAESGLLEALRRAGAETEGVVVDGIRPVPAEHARALEAARSPGVRQIVVATREALLFPHQADLVRDLLALGKPLVVLALRSPTDLAALADAPCGVAAYADVPASLRAAAEALLGHVPLPGRLPMPLAR